jgi:Pyruvate/2-oxoacid:ferredoxin oxidoreductase delta subunit
MGHVTSESYKRLQKRLDDSPQGAPASDALFKILEILFTEKEAEYVSVLPISLFTVKEAAKLWNKTEEESKKILDKLAGKGILFDFEKGDTQAYLLAPPVVGFFEFSLMRTDGKFNRKVLSELYYQYINTEEEFMKRNFGLDTPIYRVLVQEDAVQKKDKSVILDYEMASHLIKTASCITVGNCYCRHKMEHVGKECDKPQKVCLSLNLAAKSLAKHNIAKKISKKEALEILDKCIDLGLVQMGDNIQEGVGWICNCCGCCCEGLQAYKKMGYKSRIHSNFLAENNQKKCKGCGVCKKRCPVNAISMKGKKGKKKTAKVDYNRCIGCGVCTRFCLPKSIKLERRENIKFVPVNSFERYVINGIETGKLQNIIFDNYTLWTHDVLREFISIIMSLDPTKKMSALNQLKSKFMEFLMGLAGYADLFVDLFEEEEK